MFCGIRRVFRELEQAAIARSARQTLKLLMKVSLPSPMSLGGRRDVKAEAGE